MHEVRKLWFPVIQKASYCDDKHWRSKIESNSTGPASYPQSCKTNGDVLTQLKPISPHWKGNHKAKHSSQDTSIILTQKRNGWGDKSVLKLLCNLVLYVWTRESKCMKWAELAKCSVIYLTITYTCFCLYETSLTLTSARCQLIWIPCGFYWLLPQALEMASLK